jgi:hypothetical protein
LGLSERGRSRLLSQALRKNDLPKGDYYAWVACESFTAKALRTQLLVEHGAQPQWMRAAGYWRRGVADVHDNLTDRPNYHGLPLTAPRAACTGARLARDAM